MFLTSLSQTPHFKSYLKPRHNKNPRCFYQWSISEVCFPLFRQTVQQEGCVSLSSSPMSHVNQKSLLKSPHKVLKV